MATRTLGVESKRGIGKPEWLKKRLPPGGNVARVERIVEDYGLHTVCHGARCPNCNECFHEGTATFLILGERCTRRCRFCSIAKGAPEPPDGDEPERLARAVEELGLEYAVITSVTRDDLPDGGASLFAAVIRALKARIPAIRVEVLIPDFLGDPAALDTVLDAGPTVLNHNVETVPRLYASVRPGADYARSLELLGRAAERDGLPVKSGLMVGLGEREEEIFGVLDDLAASGTKLITIGQYLKPDEDRLPVAEYVPPERFERYAKRARELGFPGVASGPFVRSSHHAASLHDAYLSARRSS